MSKRKRVKKKPAKKKSSKKNVEFPDLESLPPELQIFRPSMERMVANVVAGRQGEANAVDKA